jgi:hypothetical protein
MEKYQKEYPNWVSERKKFLQVNYFKTFLYEKKRARRLYYFIKGYVDFKLGKYERI